MFTNYKNKVSEYYLRYKLDSAKNNLDFLATFAEPNLLLE